MEPLFSVITPMYKSAAFIADAIESVLCQSEKSWEMILVDDCSPDNGAGIAIAEKYSRVDERIKLIRLNVSNGSSGARNTAVKNAHGRYFAFLDSDDIWDSNYLQIMYENINTNKNENAAIFFSGYRCMNADCSREILSPYSCKGIRKFNTLLFYCPIFPSAAIVDTLKLTRPIFFREELRNLRDDYAFWLDIMKQGLVALGYRDILVSYRMRKDSLTASKFKLILPQWNVYRKVLDFNIMKSLFYLCSWALHGIWKYGNVRVFFRNFYFGRTGGNKK